MKDRLFQFFGLTTAASLLAGCAFPDRTITPSLAQTEGAGGSKPTGTCEISPEALTSVMEMQKVLQEALKAPALEVLGIGEEQSAEVLKAPENQETSVVMIDADINGQTAEGGEALVMVVGEGTTRSCTAFSRINWGADAGRFHPDSGNPADFLLQEVRIDEKGQVGVVYGGGAELLISETDGKIEETTAILEGKVIKVENESKPGLLARVFQAIKIAKATFEGPKVALGEAEASETPTSPAVPTAVVPIETQAEPTVASTDEPTAEPTKEDLFNPETSTEATIAEIEAWLNSGGREQMEAFAKEAVKNGEIAIQGTLPSPQNVRSLDYKGGDKWSTDEGTLSNGYSRLTTNTSIDGIVFGQVIKLNQSDSLDKKVEEEQLKVFKEINAFAHFVSVKDIITSGTGDPLLAVLVVLPISSNGEVSYVPSLMFLEREWRTPLVVIEGSRFVEKNFDEKELNKQVKSGDVFEFSLVETYNAKGMMGSQISFADNCQQWGIAKALGHFDDNGIIDKLRSGSLDVLGKLVKLMSSRITRK